MDGVRVDSEETTEWKREMMVKRERTKGNKAEKEEDEWMDDCRFRKEHNTIERETN